MTLERVTGVGQLVLNTNLLLFVGHPLGQLLGLFFQRGQGQLVVGQEIN